MDALAHDPVHEPKKGTGFTRAQAALNNLQREVRFALPEDKFTAFRTYSLALQDHVDGGWLQPDRAEETIYRVAELHGLRGAPGSREEIEVAAIAREVTTPPTLRDDDVGFLDQNAEPVVREIATKTPAHWKGTEPTVQRWLACARIPAGDLTLYTGNGGSGKTETATQLSVSVAAELGDWLGCVVESGTVLFLSCEEPEHNVRDRVERICRHRCIDPHSIERLHLHFPDLDDTWMVTVDRGGRVNKTPFFHKLEAWISEHRPRLVVIDSVAAVFDGEAIARRQVRAFLAMLRKLARDHDTAIVLLDHPSVRGMADGSGTANYWRNSVRSMLSLSDPEKDDPDVRQIEVKKNNYGRAGERVTLRWNGLTFTTGNLGESSPHRAAADRDVDELFLRLLDKRNSQGRPVHAKAAKGAAPAEMKDDPEANGVTADAFRRAMERLFTAGRIKTVETGPPSKPRQHIERVTE